MRCIDWQWYWPKWHLSWDKRLNGCGRWAWYEHFIIIGPLQLRFRDVPWEDHLERSETYVKDLKELLEKDLVTLKCK